MDQLSHGRCSLSLQVTEGGSVGADSMEFEGQCDLGGEATTTVAMRGASRGCCDHLF